MLMTRLNLQPDQALTPEQRAIGHSMRVLFEDHIYWCVVNWRYVEDPVFAVCDQMGYGGYTKFWFSKMFRGHVRKLLHVQGMGRHTTEEIHEFCRKGLKAFSDYLGNK